LRARDPWQEGGQLGRQRPPRALELDAVGDRRSLLEGGVVRPDLLLAAEAPAGRYGGQGRREDEDDGP
jgi:hypothetical protein